MSALLFFNCSTFYVDRPTITAEESVKVISGSEVTLECKVSAWPEPSLIWWKDIDKRVPVINGGNYTIATQKPVRGVSLIKF